MNFVMPHIPQGDESVFSARGKLADNFDYIAAWIEGLIADHAHMSCEHIDGELQAGADVIRYFATQVRPGDEGSTGG